MNTFLKIMLRNIIKGPSTIKYPFEDSPGPEKLRGKIKHDPKVCMTCHLCEYVCAGGAIRIQEADNKKGIDFVVWHNTCTFCGLCEFYCPAKAIHLTTDYHTAHLQEVKYGYYERTLVKKHACNRCGEPFIPLAPVLVKKIYGKNGDPKGLTKMCDKCRRKVTWEGGVFNQ